jgi:PKD repeat protein
VTLADASTPTPVFTAPDVTGSTTLTFEVSVSDGTDSATDTVAVTVEPLAPASFQVTNLDAPSSVVQGDQITVTADVTNEGELAGTQPVQFRVGGSTLASDPLSLEPGETQSVSLVATVPAGLAAGTYTQGVYTDDDEATAQLTVEEATTEPSLSTAVSLSPVEQTVGVGGTVAYDVVVENAEGGVGAIDLAVSVSDGSVAEITDVQLAGAAQGSDTSVTGSSATIDAFGLDTADSGPVTVATVTVDTTSVGSTALSLAVTAVGTEAGTNYAVSETNGASLVVEPSSFLLSNLDAPDSVVRGDTVTVDATVTNDGSVETTKTVAFRFDLDDDGTLAEDEVVASQDVTLGPGESQTVSLSATVPAGLDLGEYSHGVFTVDDEQTATISVTLPKIAESYAGPPQDLDGDGRYEDLNGNGEFDLVDVQAAFVNRDSPILTGNDALFDFNDNGGFDLVDVQALFTTALQND